MYINVHDCYEIADKNLIILPCPDSAGARKGAKGVRKRVLRAVFGYHHFGHYIILRANIIKSIFVCLFVCVCA